MIPIFRLPHMICGQSFPGPEQQGAVRLVQRESAAVDGVATTQSKLPVYRVGLAGDLADNAGFQAKILASHLQGSFRPLANRWKRPGMRLPPWVSP